MPGRRACDACKRRKVRCDEAVPCSKCRISQIPCEHLVVPQKRGPRVAKRPSHGSSESFQTADTLTEIGYSDMSSSRLGSPEESEETPYQRREVQISSQSNQGDASALGLESDALQICESLWARVKPALAGKSLGDVSGRCIRLFMQYIFPNTPIVHEPTLWASASILARCEAASSLFGHKSYHDVYSEIEVMRGFSLITALCSLVIAVVPCSLFEYSKSLSKPFMQASRAMLRLYEEHDLENPKSTSLTIRMWHSAIMQNTTGRIGASWHYHAEAACLAQRLRLFNESSVLRGSPLESKLLRANFWLLFLAEKTQVAFEGRPPIIDDSVCDGGITLLENGDTQVMLLDTRRTQLNASLEERIFVGFHLKRRVWTLAADIIDGIKMHARYKDGELLLADATHGADSRVSTLIDRYICFTAVVDDLPAWLRHPDGSFDRQSGPDAEAHQRACFWAQRSNIMTVYHCMKLIVLQKCIECSSTSIIGLNESTLSWALRKIEIVQDFLHELDIVPFECFKVQGEPAVDRIRRVGTILLELIHNVDNPTIEGRARSLFRRLLDHLAKLDSRASDQLVEKQPSQAAA